METAATIGISITDFWEMTPSELNIYAKAYAENKKQEYEEQISLAYINAMWTIQWLGKKHQQPRPLKEILDSIGKEKRVMTDEQMLEQVKVLNALFGGEMIEKRE
ncbi:MAG: hypothetical protein PHE03_10325 [Bacteroidales bacterium]|nr:hypothetical protein [Bacteroidales bacterium]